MRQFFERVYNQGDIAFLDELVGADVIHRGLVHGIPQLVPV
jgi:hypothetical protein